MFEKIGVTLADSGLYDVIIIGYPAHPVPIHTSIQVISLPLFGRISLKRFLIPWIVFKHINQVKPELLIINTPELLFVGALSRVFFRRKVVYDIRENYYRNVRFTPTFHALIRPLLAGMIRTVEIVTSPLVSCFFLAEKGYVQELRFVKRPLVLPNKLPASIATRFARKHTGGYSKLVFSGTLAASTGVFEAIQLCKKLQAVDPSFSLTIIGYCALPEVLSKIKNEISNVSFITLIGGDKLVPHTWVLDEVCKADVGVIIYPSNPSTQSSIPTKLYEYLALQLPVLIQHNAESHQLVEACNAGIILPESPDYSALAEELKNKRFTPAVNDSLFWESEGQKIIDRLKLLQIST